MRYTALGLLLLSIASGGELTGYISDAACGWNNARNAAEAKECARRCVDAGWDPVFVRDGEMITYKIADTRTVLPFVGNHVAIERATQGRYAERPENP